MRFFVLPKSTYLRKVFLFTHLSGFVAAFLVLAGAVSYAEEATLGPTLILLCAVVGYLSGASCYLFVQQALHRQLLSQLEVLKLLVGSIDTRNMSVEDLQLRIESYVAQTEDVVRTILVTIDDILPSYSVLEGKITELSKRARIGLEASESKRSDVVSMEEKQRQVMDQMRLLADRTQDESALSRELASSLEEMSEAMERSSEKFYETTATMEEMAASIREVGAQAEEVGRSVEETSHNLDSIGLALDKIHSGARSGADLSEQVKTDAVQGLNIVESSLQDMERISNESRKATDAMARLARQAGEVETIIEVIKGLVSDTELLAFNAAIIAAQAGDEGKGFSVVANEIRDLADRTANSATDIHRIIQGIGKDTVEVTHAVEGTAQQIAQGRNSFHSTGEALRKIVASSERSALASGDIAQLTEQENKRARTLLDEAGRNLKSVNAIVRAVKEQETGILRVEQGIEDMKAATDRIARGMEEQVRANQGFNQGLLEREEQASAVSEATRFQMEITGQVALHFNDSTERLKGNVTKTDELNRDFAKIKDLTMMLHQLAQNLTHLGQSGPGPGSAPRPR